MGVCEKDPVRSGLEKRERVVVESTRVILLQVGGWVVQKGLPPRDGVYTKPIPGSVAVAGFSIRFRGMSQIFLLGFVVVVVLGPETRYFMVLIIIKKKRSFICSAGGAHTVDLTTGAVCAKAAFVSVCVSDGTCVILPFLTCEVSHSRNGQWISGPQAPMTVGIWSCLCGNSACVTTGHSENMH